MNRTYSSLIADGANHRGTTLPIPRVLSRDLPILPGLRLRAVFPCFVDLFWDLILEVRSVPIYSSTSSIRQLSEQVHFLLVARTRHEATRECRCSPGLRLVTSALA